MPTYVSNPSSRRTTKCTKVYQKICELRARAGSEWDNKKESILVPSASPELLWRGLRKVSLRVGELAHRANDVAAGDEYPRSLCLKDVKFIWYKEYKNITDCHTSWMKRPKEDNPRRKRPHANLAEQENSRYEKGARVTSLRHVRSLPPAVNHFALPPVQTNSSKPP